jgi:hypothetical protein
MDTFMQILVWLAGAGAAIASAWLLENTDWFQAVQSKWKPYVAFGVAVVIGLVAQAVNQFVPVTLLQAIAPYAMIVINAFVYFVIQQGAHKVNQGQVSY